MRAMTVMSERRAVRLCQRVQVSIEMVRVVAKLGKLPVPNFAAGGVATPADAALCMHLGAEAVFVGSGIFKSGDPEKRAKAIVSRHHALAGLRDYRREFARPGRADERDRRRVASRPSISCRRGRTILFRLQRSVPGHTPTSSWQDLTQLESPKVTMPVPSGLARAERECDLTGLARCDRRRVINPTNYSMNSIEWTFRTWNPVTGCNGVSPGCEHCYAERMAKRLQGMGVHKYRNGFKVTIHPSNSRPRSAGANRRSYSSTP